MSKPNLFEEARVILSRVLKIEPDEIDLKSKLFDDLGIDSVDFWDIIACFDKKYKIRVTEKEAMKLETVADLVKALGEKLGVGVKR